MNWSPSETDMDLESYTPIGKEDTIILQVFQCFIFPFNYIIIFSSQFLKMVFGHF